MTISLTQPPRGAPRTFMGFPFCADLDALEADVAILGIPFGAVYDPVEAANDQSNAPAAVRAQSLLASDGLDRWDFDLDGPLFAGRDVRVVDCGDVTAELRDPAAHYARAEAATRKILARGALPVVIGGDHGVPIPVFRAFEGRGPLTLVHIDAHLDWRDEVNGVPDGYSSPIRRASELPWFERIVQIGMRGQGSAREDEVRAARDWGAEIVPAHDIHAKGMAAVLSRLPEGGRSYITIDADGLDPSVMPAVAAPVPGGLWFHQVRELIHGLAAKGPIVGMDLVEITPARDVNGISSLVAARLILNLIGALARAERIGRV